MDMIDDNQDESFFFNWTVQNFSYCLQKKGETLASPLFQLGSNSGNKWRLHLYPRGSELSDDIGYSVERFCLVANYKIEISFGLSIGTDRGLFKEMADERLRFELNNDSGFTPIFAQQENRLDAYLKNDLLTIRCRIYNVATMKSGQCFARTVINVERISYIWELRNFQFLQNEIKHTRQHPILSEIPLFTMDFFSIRGTSEDRIQIEVKQIDSNKNYFMTCEIFVLDVDGKVILSVRDEHWFKVSQDEQIWMLPYVSKKKLLDHQNIYSKDGTLSLRCDFAVSTGIEYSKVERAEYGIVLPLQSDYENTPSIDSNFIGSWKENFQRFYEEGKFSDFIVRTANKEFKVHRTILCARSEVFSAMFERDMVEARTGVLEIIDIDDDIVSKLLLFIYTDTVADLDWETAFSLYFAADKYRIVALKRQCSDFLKMNFNTSNVCDALCLSNMHQDEDLKSAARDYIKEHHSEIMNSEEWNKFMVDYVQLASETMHLFIKNLKV